jgi:glycosyltransferase involved in cell wall biosynthesis
MKIALYTNFFYPSIGGCETVADLLATGLSELGHEVCLLTRTPLINANELDRSYSITRIDSRALMKQHIMWADIVLMNGVATYGLDFCLTLNKPYVLIFQGPQSVCPINLAWNEGRCTYALTKCIACKIQNQTHLSNLTHLLKYALIRFYIQKASANVFISESLKSQTNGVLNIKNSFIIGNPFDHRIFNMEVAKENSSNSIVFAGRLVKEKGVELLLEAYALAADKKELPSLRIIGNGILLPYLQDIAEKLKIKNKIQWLGWKTGKNLAEQFASACAVIVPSIYEEPFGIVTIEALACGTPVLVNNRGALPELVPIKNWCIEPSKESWTNALLNLQYYSYEERKKFANANKKRFSYTVIAHQYSQLLQNILNSL